MSNGRILSKSREKYKIKQRKPIKHVLSHKKLSSEEFKKWKKEIREDEMTDWRKYIHWAKAINKFRDIYEEIRQILISNGLPEDYMWE